MSTILLRYKEDGTLEFHRRITEVPYDAFEGLAKSMSRRQVGGRRSAAMDQTQVLADGEERNQFMNSITWWSRDFLRLVVGETEARGAITFTCLRALHGKSVLQSLQPSDANNDDSSCFSCLRMSTMALCLEFHGER